MSDASLASAGCTDEVNDLIMDYGGIETKIHSLEAIDQRHTYSAQKNREGQCYIFWWKAMVGSLKNTMIIWERFWLTLIFSLQNRRVGLVWPHFNLILVYPYTTCI